jgi:hypothetical protein
MVEFKTTNFFILDPARLCGRDLVLVERINKIQDFKYKVTEIETGKFKILDKLTNIEIIESLSVVQIYNLLTGSISPSSEKLSTEEEESLKFFSTKNTYYYSFIADLTK